MTDYHQFDQVLSLGGAKAISTFASAQINFSHTIDIETNRNGY